MLLTPLHSSATRGKTMVALLGLVLAAGAGVRAQDAAATAWQVLLTERPEAADDTSISTLERKILQVLTPKQADAYADGRDAAEIALPGGETLAEFIDRTERARAPGLVIRPLEPCTLFDTRSVGKLAAGDRRTVQVRGPETDYSAQGGAADGCAVPGLVGGSLKVNAARAVLLAVEVREPEGTGELALWPSHGPPAPRTGLAAYGPEAAVTVPSLIVPLCDEESVNPCRDGDLELRLDGAGAHVVLTIHGVLEPAVATIDAADSKTATVPDKSTTAPYWEKRTDNDNLYYTDGSVGLGTDWPARTLHVDGGLMLRDPIDEGMVIRSWRRYTEGYAGGGPHETTLLTLSTPYQDESGVLTRDSVAFSSPEVLGIENAYLYAFGGRNLRLGAADNGYRQAEIEIYDSMGEGKIFFRTGAWQDPGSTPGVDTKVRMVIDNEGRVGIGTTQPTQTLHLQKEYGTTLWIRTIGWDSTPTFKISNDRKVWGLRVDGGDEDQLQIRDFSASANRVTIDADGNVGIGTETPQSMLDVAGDITVSGNIRSNGDICIGNCQ
ncbi:MAG: hypothetical protein GY842_17320 [bacterium]|nr:hypothetical protein [bacterium]